VVAVTLVPVFLVVCALLVVAGIGKLFKPRATRESLALAGLHLPSLLVRCLGVGELAIGITAAIRPSAVTGALVALAYGAFCAFLVALRRTAGSHADCGCFGEADADAGNVHLLLNIIACLAGVLAAVAPPHGVGWALTRPALIAAPLLIGTTAAVLAAYLAFTVFPAAWRAYGSGAEH
jgi:uncharacterized protein YjeT (DUF2065 family)